MHYGFLLEVSMSSRREFHGLPLCLGAIRSLPLTRRYPLNPELAKDTLRVLARYQASEVDDWRDAQPGKILHESQ